MLGWLSPLYLLPQKSRPVSEYSTTIRLVTKATLAECSFPATHINQPEGRWCHDSKNFHIHLVVADDFISYVCLRVGNLS
jgi:hypothetical protein